MYNPLRKVTFSRFATYYRYTWTPPVGGFQTMEQVQKNIKKKKNILYKQK